MSGRVELQHDAGQSNVQLKHYYKYAACSRGFTVAWILLTLCFMIINIIVFFEPEWIGDTPSSRIDSSNNYPDNYYPGSSGVGYVGLYQLCEFVSFGHQRVCDGMFQDFSTILTDAFRAATFFIGVSCLLIFLCILLFLLFLCVYEVYVYIICGTLQLISTVFMFLGCVIFPAGWNHMYVRRICGDNVGRHKIGDCEMRWAYILAIIGIFDILMLTILAFVLACRHRRKWRNVNSAKMKAPPDERDGYVVDVAPASAVSTSAPSRYRTVPSSYAGGYAGSQSGRVNPAYDDGVRRRNGSTLQVAPRAASNLGLSQPGRPQSRSGVLYPQDGNQYRGTVPEKGRNRRGSF